jgi:8-oxo-dGTP pyrophosphatase MutT (NUDIX family)
MIDERSAGAILCSLNVDVGRLEYLLLHHTLGHWDFPKGNIEADENPIQAARREIYEETGIKEIEFAKRFREKIEYYYKRSDRLVRKRVTFYIAKTNTRQVTLSSEHDGYAWKDYEAAIQHLTFINAKKVLKRAKMYLTSEMSVDH